MSRTLWSKGLILTGVLSLLSMPALAGITVGGTRVIYPGDKKEVPLNVSSSQDDGVLLIRSWIENNEPTNKTAPPFVITPPLFRIDPGQENTLRLSQTNTASLPQDRETLYWLNVMAVPPAAQGKNALQFSLNTKIKLLYRPAALDDHKTASEAYQKLTFSRSGGGVTVKNPTPYYISVFKMSIGGVEVQDKNITVPPAGSYPLKAAPSGNDVRWSAINDNGGLTKEANAHF